MKTLAQIVLGKRMTPSCSFKRQRGFTMIEIIVGIAITAGLLIWVAGRAHLLGASADGTTETGNVNLLHTQIKAGKNSAGYGASGADLGAALIAAGQLPSTFTTAGTTILNPWNVAYVITSTGYGFTITDTVPTAACAKMVVSQSQTGDWATITVNGGTAQTAAINLQTAGTLCTQANANVIVMTSST